VEDSNTMRVGDLIECNNDHRAIIMGMQMLYPGHPQSPVRNYEVLWLNEAPKHSRKFGQFYILSAFAVKRVISRASR